MNSRFILYLIALVLIVSSCEQPLYIPNTQNIPSLTKQGDIQGSASTGSNGWDLQGAYAVSDEIGVMVNGSFANHHNDSSDNYNAHQFIEFGIGYNYFVNRESYSEGDSKILLSAYGGYGFGKAEGLYEYSVFDHYEATYNEGVYSRYFLQPSFTMSYPQLELCLALRTTYVAFDEVKYLSTDGSYEKILADKDYNFYFEPTLTWRLGGDRVKFFNQMGVSMGQFSTVETSFRNRPLIFIFGVHYNTNILSK